MLYPVGRDIGTEGLWTQKFDGVTDVDVSKPVGSVVAIGGNIDCAMVIELNGLGDCALADESSVCHGGEIQPCRLPHVGREGVGSIGEH